MLSASIVLDLTAPVGAGEDVDRRRIFAAQLEAAPAGTRVVVLVGSRRWNVGLTAVRLLHEHVNRLNLDIRGCDGETIAAWHRAIRSGDLEMSA